MAIESKIVGAGVNADVETQVDKTRRAVRVSLNPVEVMPNGGILGGHYSVSWLSGSMAAGIASSADVFHVWFKSDVKRMLLQKFTVQSTTLTAFTTLGGAPLDLFIAHSGTAAGSGGTALTFPSNNNRLRYAFAPTAFQSNGEIRGATTAALTLPTGLTVEGNPIASCMGAPWLQHQSAQQVLYDWNGGANQPVELVSGDGLVLRTNAPGATGVWVFAVTMQWAEVGTLD